MKIKDKIEYRVQAGGTGSAYRSAKTLKEARKLKKEASQDNPYQGGGYTIVKVTTSYKEVK